MNEVSLQPLTGSEALRRNELVSLIDAKLEDALKVGLAFYELRNSKLYRDTHPDFDSFCKDRWEVTGRRIYQLIDAADVAISMKQPPENERQLRELGTVPEGDRDEVMNEARGKAKAEGRKVAAADVRKAAAERKSDDDDVKHPVEEALSCRSRFDGICTSISLLINKFDELAESPGGAYLRDRGNVLMRQRFKHALKEVQAIIQQGKPEAACQRCEGSGMCGRMICAICEGNGFVTKQGLE